MKDEYRHLRADRLGDTAQILADRLRIKFPEAGLSEVGDTVVDIVRAAAERTEAIQRPIWWLRIVLLALAGVTLAAAIAFAFTLQGNALANFLEFTSKTGGALVYLFAGVVFLITLETRWKRWRAVQAIHELRAVAHIIDMHQLAKVPDEEAYAGQKVLPPPEMRKYLTFCTEMLAILSKIGQLYVQDFPDGTTLAAVDQFENLATGLSSKIWQKIMILDQDSVSSPTSP